MTQTPMMDSKSSSDLKGDMYEVERDIHTGFMREALAMVLVLQIFCYQNLSFMVLTNNT